VALIWPHGWTENRYAASRLPLFLADAPVADIRCGRRVKLQPAGQICADLRAANRRMLSP